MNFALAAATTNANAGALTPAATTTPAVATPTPAENFGVTASAAGGGDVGNVGTGVADVVGNTGTGNVGTGVAANAGTSPANVAGNAGTGAANSSAPAPPAAAPAAPAAVAPGDAIAARVGYNNAAGRRLHIQTASATQTGITLYRGGTAAVPVGPGDAPPAVARRGLEVFAAQAGLPANERTTFADRWTVDLAAQRFKGNAAPTTRGGDGSATTANEGGAPAARRGAPAAPRVTGTNNLGTNGTNNAAATNAASARRAATATPPAANTAPPAAAAAAATSTGNVAAGDNSRSRRTSFSTSAKTTVTAGSGGRRGSGVTGEAGRGGGEVYGGGRRAAQDFGAAQRAGFATLSLSEQEQPEIVADLQRRQQALGVSGTTHGETDAFARMQRTQITQQNAARVWQSLPPSESGAAARHAFVRNNHAQLAQPTFTEYLELRGDAPRQLSGASLTNEVGTAMNVRPNRAPQNAAEQTAFENGTWEFYEGDVRAQIDVVTQSIRRVGGERARTTAMPVVFSSEETGMVQLSLFRVQRPDGGEKFVDGGGRVYASVQEWAENQRLPAGKISYPTDGRLAPDAATGRPRFTTEDVRATLPPTTTAANTSHENAPSQIGALKFFQAIRAPADSEAPFAKTNQQPPGTQSGLGTNPLDAAAIGTMMRAAARGGTATLIADLVRGNNNGDGGAATLIANLVHGSGGGDGRGGGNAARSPIVLGDGGDDGGDVRLAGMFNNGGDGRQPAIDRGVGVVAPAVDQVLALADEWHNMTPLQRVEYIGRVMFWGKMTAGSAATQFDGARHLYGARQVTDLIAQIKQGVLSGAATRGANQQSALGSLANRAAPTAAAAIIAAAATTTPAAAVVIAAKTPPPAPAVVARPEARPVNVGGGNFVGGAPQLKEGDPHTGGTTMTTAAASGAAGSLTAGAAAGQKTARPAQSRADLPVPARAEDSPRKVNQQGDSVRTPGARGEGFAAAENAVGRAGDTRLSEETRRILDDPEFLSRSEVQRAIGYGDVAVLRREIAVELARQELAVKYPAAEGYGLQSDIRLVIDTGYKTVHAWQAARPAQPRTSVFAEDGRAWRPLTDIDLMVVKLSPDNRRSEIVHLEQVIGGGSRRRRAGGGGELIALDLLEKIADGDGQIRIQRREANGQYLNITGSYYVGSAARERHAARALAPAEVPADLQLGEAHAMNRAQLNHAAKEVIGRRRPRSRG